MPFRFSIPAQVIITNTYQTACLSTEAQAAAANSYLGATGYLATTVHQPTLMGFENKLNEGCTLAP